MDYLSLAMEAAQMQGAEYADIRIQKTSSNFIWLRDLSLKRNRNSIVHGYGIRVFKNGSFGFAHSNIFTKDAVLETVKRACKIAELSARVPHNSGLKLADNQSYVDFFKTPYKIDPFKVSIKDKLELMLMVNRILLSYAPIKMASFALETQKDEKLFASTLGSKISSETLYVAPRFTATAISDTDSQSRTWTPGAVGCGYEILLENDLETLAHQVAEEAIMKVNADTLGEEERRDLVLSPTHLALTMHESVGHPTELDRVLGWEADMAGLSFATVDKLKKYQYGSKIVNFVADNTLDKGLATAGYDDDGVINQRWYIIKDGILNEYGTTRATAPFIGETMSRGCNRATHYYDFPINRIPNLYLEPGKELLSPEELIADTEDGIFIDDQGSFSIDQHRINFQFGGDLFWEIKNGKKTRMLKKVIYKSCNPEFWNSCDKICDDRFFKTFGVDNCGKGQPSQRGRMTHGGAMARFKNIRVGGSK